MIFYNGYLLFYNKFVLMYKYESKTIDRIQAE